ncbi:LysR family transcriptional regulator [Aestuariispira ectoiniformans]|uniref:LysR family transcriptional regulator n=1 Tax=Aestuariispira ectoiniformans TaxID=2775080 RepID=UPI00223BC48C|nr:LysR family transcriptional regulator [Aestuariispira ectoiniformans]
MDKLNGMVVFAAVVETGSFTAAARELGQSKSAVSKQVSKLEDRLGARLLHRTTRQLTLTDVGQAFYERCQRIVEEAEEAELAVTTMQQCPQGRLKLSLPHSYGGRHITPILPIFMERYPDITVDISFNDRRVDLLEEGFDLAVRVGILQDSSLIARKITEVRSHVISAPSYWDKNGRPTHPQELADHNCFTYANIDTPNIWRFPQAGGGDISVRVDGRLHSNNGDATLEAVKAGLGVARLPTFFFCENELKSGDLEEVLSDYSQARMGVYAVYPHARHLTTKVRVFIDFLVEQLAKSYEDVL